MSRIIDADKTIDIIDNEITMEDSAYNDGLCRAIQIIGEQQIVKAIPIDELFKFIDSRVVQPDGTVKYTEDITHLQTFISEWRMDNEEGYRDEVNRWWAEHSSRFD